MSKVLTRPAEDTEQRVVGEYDHLLNLLAAARLRGELVQHSPIVEMPDAYGRPSGKWMVAMQLRKRSTDLVPVDEQVARRKVRRRRLSRGAKVAIIVGVVLLAAVGFAAIVVIQWLLQHLMLVLGTAVAVGAVWVALGRRGVCCPGLHCPGCSHH